MTLNIPGLPAAVQAEIAGAIEKENQIRVQSFLGFTETVHGFEFEPLTLSHVLGLESIGNAFVCGGHVGPYDVASLVLMLSGQPKGIRRWWLLQRVGMADARALCEAINEYMSEAYMDVPGGKSGGGPSYFSGAAALVDFMASEYGWTEQEILRVPLKRLFQYTKAIIARRNPNAIQFNPSDKIKGRWLAEVNRGN